MDYSSYGGAVGGGGGGGGGGSSTDLTIEPFAVNPFNYGAFADGSNHAITPTDITNHTAGGSGRLWIGPVVRTVTDGVTTSGSNVITSATANFASADRGHFISGAGIPQNSVIKDVVDAATVHITNNLTVDNATISASGVTIKVGDYDVGDYWDYVALQEAIYVAFNNGTLTPNKANWRFNRPLYIPAGLYRVNKSPTMWEVQGGKVYGDGRLTTQIASLTSGVPAWVCNGLWYTKFSGIQFFSGVGMNSGLNGVATDAASIDDPLFVVDGNWDTLHTQGIQGNTWEQCHWDGSFKRDPLFFMCPAGTNSQGSENLWLNCHFNNAFRTAYTNETFNALQNTFIGGDFTQHVVGLRIVAGTVNLYSVGFQARKPQQIDYNGYDLVIANSADSHSSMSHCRSESFKMASINNGAVVTFDSNVLDSVPPQVVWTAGHNFSQGHMVQGITGGHGNGHVHRCIVAGTSGGTEPVWTDTAASIPTLEYNDGDMTSGSAVLHSTQGNFANMTSGNLAGRGIFVVGAGVSGGILYSTIVSKTDNNNIVLADAASTTTTTGINASRYVFGPITVDGGVSWIQDEFIELSLNSPCSVRNCSFRWGQIRAVSSLWPCVITQSSFARADWEYVSAPGIGGATTPNKFYPAMLSQAGQFTTTNQLTLNGGYNSGSTAIPIAPPPRAAAFTTTTGTITTTLSRAVHTLTPTGDCTINATGGNAGDRATIIITTTGATSRNITFGTNFVSNGVLATGTVAAKVFIVEFRCKDGVTWVELARNGPM